MVFWRVIAVFGSLLLTTGCQSTASMKTCGNAQLDEGESCDGDLFEGTDNCQDLGFQGGSLSCSPLCELDVSRCDGCSLFGPISGCPDGQACMLFPPNGSVSCNVPGTAKENRTCETSEHCEAGLVCMFRTCSRLCREGETCTTQYECLDAGWPNGAGFCPALPDSCDPIGRTGCAGSYACYVTSMNGSIGCLPANDAQLNEPCSASDYCAPGLVCAYSMTNTCHQLCRVDSDCDFGSCTIWSGWSNGMGFCVQ